VRQRDGLDDAAGSLERGNAGFNGRAHLRIEALGEVLGGNADAQARFPGSLTGRSLSAA